MLLLLLLLLVVAGVCASAGLCRVSRSPGRLWGSLQSLLFFFLSFVTEQEGPRCPSSAKVIALARDKRHVLQIARERQEWTEWTVLGRGGGKGTGQELGSGGPGARLKRIGLPGKSTRQCCHHSGRCHGN
ncbi:hypothetical protein SRHO_G00080840 [Serrasalmus rhombeus]